MHPVRGGGGGAGRKGEDNMSNVIVFCVMLVGLGWAGAQVFGLNGWSAIAVIVAFALWTGAILSAGPIIAFKELTHAKMRKIVDGEEKCFVTLKLGPFGYTIEVPEEVKME